MTRSSRGGSIAHRGSGVLATQYLLKPVKQPVLPLVRRHRSPLTHTLCNIQAASDWEKGVENGRGYRKRTKAKTIPATPNTVVVWVTTKVRTKL